MKSNDLRRRLDKCEWSARVANALKAEGWETLGDLVNHDRATVARIPNLGYRSLREIEEVLASLGLRLGMNEKQTAAVSAAERWQRLERISAEQVDNIHRLSDRLSVLETMAKPDPLKLEEAVARIDKIRDDMGKLHNRLQRIDIDASWVEALRLRLSTLETSVGQLMGQGQLAEDAPSNNPPVVHPATPKEVLNALLALKADIMELSPEDVTDELQRIVSMVRSAS